MCVVGSLPERLLCMAHTAGLETCDGRQSITGKDHPHLLAQSGSLRQSPGVSGIEK